MSLSTDDPLQFHFTKEPLIEEYGMAKQVTAKTLIPRLHFLNPKPQAFIPRLHFLNPKPQAFIPRLYFPKYTLIQK